MVAAITWAPLRRVELQDMSFMTIHTFTVHAAYTIRPCGFEYAKASILIKGIP